MSSLPRRAFLTLAGVTVLGVTGCQVSDPVVTGGPAGPPPAPSPTPEPVVPGQQAALAHEVDLAALAGAAYAAADRLRLGPGQKAATGWMAVAHEIHVTALLNPQPTARATALPTPAPGRTPHPRPDPSATLRASTRDQAISELRDRLERALADYRQAALGSQGPTSLVWGSLAAYARSAQTALIRDAPRPEPPDIPVRELEPWSDTEAEQQALRQVHALIYGYQAAIPWLGRAETQTAYDLVVRRRELRDRLAKDLRERGQTAPAAEPAYALPRQPTDRNTAAELLWRMEAAFAPFAGAWLAAATAEETRRLALENLEQSSALCLDWGGPLVIWPGWPGV